MEDEEIIQDRSEGDGEYDEVNFKRISRSRDDDEHKNGVDPKGHKRKEVNLDFALSQKTSTPKSSKQLDRVSDSRPPTKSKSNANYIPSPPVIPLAPHGMPLIPPLGLINPFGRMPLLPNPYQGLPMYYGLDNGHDVENPIGRLTKEDLELLNSSSDEENETAEIKLSRRPPLEDNRRDRRPRENFRREDFREDPRHDKRRRMGEPPHPDPRYDERMQYRVRDPRERDPRYPREPRDPRDFHRNYDPRRDREYRDGPPRDMPRYPPPPRDMPRDREEMRRYPSEHRGPPREYRDVNDRREPRDPKRDGRYPPNDSRNPSFRGPPPSRSGPSSRAEGSRTLLLSSLADTTTKELIENEFGSIGPIESVALQGSQAIVKFKDVSDAIAAKRRFDKNVLDYTVINVNFVL